MEIVALKNILPHDINNKIVKFIGIKPRKFVEKITFLKRLYREVYLWAHKIDEDYDMKYNEHYKQFYEWTLVCFVNCERCHKNKRKVESYCHTCHRIESTHVDGF